ncbi:transposase, partial [Turicibacter sanguinis]
PYTNGPIEGINNKIKVIKRIAFGYRSFYHFKSRILMIQNLTKPKRKILAA